MHMFKSNQQIFFNNIIAPQMLSSLDLFTFLLAESGSELLVSTGSGKKGPDINGWLILFSIEEYIKSLTSQ